MDSYDSDYERAALGALCPHPNLKLGTEAASKLAEKARLIAKDIHDAMCDSAGCAAAAVEIALTRCVQIAMLGHMPEMVDEYDVTTREAAAVSGHKELLADLLVWLPNLAQLLDGWHQDGTAWSEWDESVRSQMAVIQQKVEALRRRTP